MDKQETAEECGSGGLIDCTALHKTEVTYGEKSDPSKASDDNAGDTNIVGVKATADLSGDKSDAGNKSEEISGAFVVGVTAGHNIAASYDKAGDATSVGVQATSVAASDNIAASDDNAGEATSVGNQATIASLHPTEGHTPPVINPTRALEPLWSGG